jgi:hypothetical protein
MSDYPQPRYDPEHLARFQDKTPDYVLAELCFEMLQHLQNAEVFLKALLEDKNVSSTPITLTD